jgi:hypothetical protein
MTQVACILACMLHDTRRGRDRLSLIVAVSLFALAATDASPAWAGSGCLTTPSTQPAIVWAQTEAQARESSLRLCRSSHQSCRIFQCFPNIDSQQQADELFRRMVVKTFAEPPK